MINSSRTLGWNKTTYISYQRNTLARRDLAPPEPVLPAVPMDGEQKQELDVVEWEHPYKVGKHAPLIARPGPLHTTGERLDSFFLYDRRSHLGTCPDNIPRWRRPFTSSRGSPPNLMEVAVLWDYGLGPSDPVEEHNFIAAAASIGRVGKREDDEQGEEQEEDEQGEEELEQNLGQNKSMLPTPKTSYIYSTNSQHNFFPFSFNLTISHAPP
ncbi:hypothetical protein PG996_000200 [Apiospora saccharicola]|uniref:Uncharacterized protein n=1 Tax=Apiospora saccharicola TaxID=335842 RepID=A0ABR1WD32_9PEZI